jgi:hypothetical protein
MRPTFPKVAAHVAVLVATVWHASAAAAQPDTSVPVGACAPGEVVADEPGRVSIAGGRVSLVPLDGMVPATGLYDGEEPDFWGSPSPELLLRNQAGTTAALWFYNTVPRWTPRALRFTVATLEFVESTNGNGIAWIRQEAVEMGGVEWLLLEYRRTGREGNFHVQHYWTRVDNRSLVAKFEAPIRRRVREELTALAGTLQVRDCIPAAASANASPASAPAVEGAAEAAPAPPQPFPSAPRR